MNGVYFVTFILGIIVFGAGIGIGWSMRGSVKEEEYLKFKEIKEQLERLRWKINDLTEGE